MHSHPKANGTMEVFNKILENALTKVCNANKDDWDRRIPMVLWAYQTTCKHLTKHAPLRLVYGLEAVMSMEFLVPSFHTISFTQITELGDSECKLEELMQLEEVRLLVKFHQNVEKA